MYTLETTNAEKSKETKNAKHPSKKFEEKNRTKQINKSKQTYNVWAYKTKSQFFEKIYKIDKFLVRWKKSSHIYYRY